MVEPPMPTSARTPPPIPPARADAEGHPRHPLLLWVRSGTAHVRTDDETLHVRASEGVWVPPDGWSRREVVTEPGTVAFPLSPSPAPGLPETMTHFDVPVPWQDWLIQLFNIQVTPFEGRGFSREQSAELLRGLSARVPAPPRSAPGVDGLEGHRLWELFEVPRTPKARGARTVAEELIRDPALDLSIDDWAERVLTSPRTLLRDFTADSGLSFQQWRIRCRLSVSAGYLLEGCDVDYVAARVGFTSRNGFTRAFKRHCGITPHEFKQLRDIEMPAGAHARLTRARSLVHALGGSDALGKPPSRIPAARTPPHRNGSHVLSWMYRGSGYLEIDGRRYERKRGVATWIPAEHEHITGLREDSVSLPLGNASTRDMHMETPLQTQFSSAWDDYLMHCAVSARTTLRPENFDPRRIINLFADQLAGQQALELPMPRDPPARAAAIGYLRELSMMTGPPEARFPVAIRRIFIEETGMTASQWCYAARMRVARDLLRGGAKPVAVARRVGYAHLTTFSAAFSRFHGCSAREYRERLVR